MRPLLVFAHLLLAAAPMSAQTIWTMGSPWTDLDQVIQMAAPGDIVRLQGFSFPPFALTKGLTLIGPGLIVPGVLTSESQATTIAAPPGQVAHVVGVTFAPHPVFGMVMNRVDASGAVTFEDCTFRGGSPANLIASGIVLMHHCTVFGGAVNGSSIVSGGVHVQSGVCSIVACTLDGANAAFSSSYSFYIVPSTPALTVSGGMAHVSASMVTGGSGMQHPVFGGPAAGSPAVFAPAGTTVITDCRLVAGASPVALPGPAALAGTANTTHARSLLIGGGGTPTGAPTAGPVQNVPQLVGIRIDPGFHIGLVATLTAISGSTQPIALLASFDPTPTSHPLVIGPVLGPPSQCVPLLLAFPAAGQPITHAISVPNLPGLLHTKLYAQAWQLDGNLVRVSAGVCGVVH